jgi:hypothetical protein
MSPGVRVEKLTLAGDTPALKFTPAGAGNHPVALLAHGYSASKETVFWYAQSLCAAGFVCYAVDLPGHGESQKPYSLLAAAHALGRAGQSIGPVDVMFGHSMGGFAAGESVREGLLQPKLVIAAGADARTGEHGTPLLLLVGQFDEFFKPSELKTRTDAPTIVSPWSNHGFELFDPLLVNAAVKAACAAVGKPHPPASTTWCWNVAGVFLALLGAAALALALPPFPPRWSCARGIRRGDHRRRLLPHVPRLAGSQTTSARRSVANHCLDHRSGSPHRRAKTANTTLGLPRSCRRHCRRSGAGHEYLVDTNPYSPVPHPADFADCCTRLVLRDNCGNDRFFPRIKIKRRCGDGADHRVRPVSIGQRSANRSRTGSDASLHQAGSKIDGRLRGPIPIAPR